jgi:hypothetical protein
MPASIDELNSGVVWFFQEDLQEAAYMAHLQHIESEIEALPEAELQKFRAWFARFDASKWDRDFASDVAAGKLDVLASEALEQYGKGACKQL